MYPGFDIGTMIWTQTNKTFLGLNFVYIAEANEVFTLLPRRIMNEA
jgi:hypothetical protein